MQSSLVIWGYRMIFNLSETPFTVTRTNTMWFIMCIAIQLRMIKITSRWFMVLSIMGYLVICVASFESFVTEKTSSLKITKETYNIL